MDTVEEILAASGIQKMSDYFHLYKALEEARSENKLDHLKKIKVCLLTSFTTKGYKEILTVEGVRNGIDLSVHMCEYNQYAQEILNPESSLYAFKPDIVILFIDTQTVLGEQYFSPYIFGIEDRKKIIAQRQKEISGYIDMIVEKSGSMVICHNFSTPTYSPVGILEDKQEFGYIESMELLNNNLRDLYKKNDRVFIFNFDRFCSRIGKDLIVDDRMYYVGDFRLSTDLAPSLCKEYIKYIRAYAGLSPKKCIVLDLDRTLWGGIIGEDGMEGIQLGPTVEGRPFWEFQKFLLSMFDRGIILAVNSKNNFDDAIKVLREHPYMVLRENHFAAMRINWNDKVANLKDLAEELNIGLDSMLFIDDDNVNRDMVKSFLPEVKVVDLPEDPSAYVRIFQNLTDFESMYLTDDDKERGKMYTQQRVRREFESSATSIDEYLKGLEMSVKIKNVDSLDLPRVVQLLQKTNQWNMTTKRYNQIEVGNFIEDPLTDVICLSAVDRFGDNGVTAVVIAKKDNDVIWFDSFLLSCRIIGRGIEKALLWHLIERAREVGVKYIKAHFIPTKKNSVAKDFYKNQGFELLDETEGAQLWMYDINKQFIKPDYINIVLE